ncbi:MAG: PDDEXK nuclease domain-containing protein [Bacteroidia bacterium]|jgi:predicted nuclease of restriction endonuclease-like (RecB) superfamily|nr:PDDEXK nuclease domain-containing protein [Bacteroidia bacterium]
MKAQKTLPAYSRKSKSVSSTQKKSVTIRQSKPQVIKPKIVASESKGNSRLYNSVKKLVLESKASVAVTINQQLTMLYWNIGTMIKSDILKKKRANYGEQVISNLSVRMTREFGKGWSKSQLWNCLDSVETFPSKRIISTLSRELSWSHLRELFYIKDAVQREFYLQMCRRERWSVRQLRERIDTMLFERTALSKKPVKVIKEELKLLNSNKAASPDAFFRDPYLLDFLGLKDVFSEKDLETSIIIQLQQFITEVGNDFAFLARQKKIQIDGEEYYIDLLFYHRQLQRLVVIDLKLGKFRAGYKAQMELYLNWLNKHERKINEAEPIGLILCADKSQEHIELLELNKGNIRVAQYYTAFPNKTLLKRKLQQAIKTAKTKTEMKLPAGSRGKK